MFLFASALTLLFSYVNVAGEVAALSSTKISGSRRLSMIKHYDSIGKMYVANLNLNEIHDNDDETASHINASFHNGGDHMSARVRTSDSESSYQDGIAELLEEWEEPELQDEDGTVGDERLSMTHSSTSRFF